VQTNTVNQRKFTKQDIHVWFITNVARGISRWRNALSRLTFDVEIFSKLFTNATREQL